MDLVAIRTNIVGTNNIIIIPLCVGVFDNCDESSIVILIIYLDRCCGWQYRQLSDILMYRKYIIRCHLGTYIAGLDGCPGMKKVHKVIILSAVIG